MFSLKIDNEADALYLKLSENPTVRTVEIDVMTFVDLDRDDRVVGIEGLGLHRLLPMSEIAGRFELAEGDWATVNVLYPNGKGSLARAASLQTAQEGLALTG